MRRILFAALIAVAWSDAHAQSSLPPCPKDSPTRWTNCFASWTYYNGIQYAGEWRDSKYHGQGTFTRPDGTKYVGEFKDGKYEGAGAYTSAGGEKYVGEYKDGKRNGDGISYNPDGTIRVAGLWSGDALAETYSVSTNRFPFDERAAVSASADNAQNRFADQIETTERQTLKEPLATKQNAATSRSTTRLPYTISIARPNDAPGSVLSTNTPNPEN